MKAFLFAKETKIRRIEMWVNDVFTLETLSLLSDEYHMRQVRKKFKAWLIDIITQ